MMPSQLRRLVLGRRRFWIYVAVILGIKIALLVVITVAPRSFDYLKHLDTWLMLGLAFVVGARFADLRWPRWLGIGLVILFSFVIPIVLVFVNPPRSNPGSETPMDLMPDLAWVSTVALLALLVIAGLRPSPTQKSSSDSTIGPTPGT